MTHSKNIDELTDEFSLSIKLAMKEIKEIEKNIPWNKGLTKDTDQSGRLMEMSLKQTKTMKGNTHAKAIDMTIIAQNPNKIPTRKKLIEINKDYKKQIEKLSIRLQYLRRKINAEIILGTIYIPYTLKTMEKDTEFMDNLIKTGEWIYESACRIRHERTDVHEYFWILKRRILDIKNEDKRASE